MTISSRKEDVKSGQLQYITLMQIIGCVLVIFGHSYPFRTEIPLWLLKIREFIYLFHMPLFVWCSAVLMIKTKQSDRYSFRLFARRRAKRILLPYAVLSLGGILPKAVLSPLLNDSLEINAYSLARSFLVPRENIWGHFWFLPMIFFMGIIGYVIEKAARKKEKIVWGLATLLLLPLSFLKFDWGVFLGINDLLKYMWVYALGSFFAVIFREKMWGYRVALFKTAASLLVAFLLFFLFAKRVLLSPVIAFLMIGTIATVSMWLTESRSLKFRGILKSTYAIFIVSWPCQLIVEIILELLMAAPIYVIMPGMFLSGCIGPLVIIKVILRIEAKIKRKIFSPLLGM